MTTINLIAGLICVGAAIWVLSTKTWMWPRGGWSKAGWAAAAIWVTPDYFRLLIPVGAGLAIHRTWRARVDARRYTHVPAIPLPYAAGQADHTWWNIPPAQADHPGGNPQPSEWWLRAEGFQLPYYPPPGEHPAGNDNSSGPDTPGADK